MGVFIGTKRCNIVMGYGSFSYFRIEVAKAFSEDFGEKYKDYLNSTCKELCWLTLIAILHFTGYNREIWLMLKNL